MKSPTPQKRIGRAVVVAAFLTYPFTLAAMFATFTADDAFILARVAEHAWRFGDPAFNLGDRVNVVTSPLAAGTMALLFAATGHTMLAYKALSGIVVMVSLLSAMLSLEGAGRRSALFLSLTVASPFVALWTYGGLETPMLLGAVTLIACSTVPATGGSRRHCAALALGVIAASWARPDSALFSVFPLAGVALAHLRARRSVAWIVGTVAASSLAVLLPAAYFGHALPTPWFLKTPRLWPPAYVLKNAFYLGNFLFLSGALAPLLLRGRRTLEASPSPAGPSWIIAGLVAEGAYGLSCASVHMMFSYRLFVPYLPAIALLTCGRASRAKPSWTVIAAILALQGGLSWYVLERSINPTLLNLLHLGVRGPDDTLALQLDPPGFRPYLFEYPREGASAYASGLLRVLRESLGDLKRDWSLRPSSATRAPRILTSAAGQLPYGYPEAYVYDVLSSFRLACDYDLARSADYVMQMSPRGGSFEPPLGSSASRFALISQRPLWFDGESESVDIYFQSQPEPNLLPPTLSAPCRPESGVDE